MEKFKSMDEFSVFNLWNIKKVNKEELHKKSEDHTMMTAEQKDSPKFGGGLISKNLTSEQRGEEKDEDLDLALPNDEEDIHKYH
jgi:hypothetical protein